jgi:hypothetical protein
MELLHELNSEQDLIETHIKERKEARCPRIKTADPSGAKLKLATRRRKSTIANVMVKAVVCINTTSCSKQVASILRSIDGVSEVYSSVGAYDVIAVVYGRFSELKQVVLPQIRSVNNVKSTLTLTVIGK